MRNGRDLGVAEDAFHLPERMHRVIPPILVDSEIEGLTRGEFHGRTWIGMAGQTGVVVPLRGVLSTRLSHAEQPHHGDGDSDEEEGPGLSNHNRPFKSVTPSCGRSAPPRFPEFGRRFAHTGSRRSTTDSTHPLRVSPITRQVTANH